jgi:hypothetical protein
MSKAQQDIPTLVMWERILRIRREMYDKESSSSTHTCEGTLVSNAMSLENIREELMRRATMSETLDMPWDQWDSFSDWSKKR